MRKPSDAEGCLKWLVTWANCGHGEADQVRGSAYLKECQKKLRSWPVNLYWEEFSGISEKPT